MVVPENPSEDFPPFFGRPATKQSGSFHYIVLDCSGLAQHETSVNHDGNLAHWVQLQEFFATSVSIEEIDIYWTPFEAGELHGQSGLVGVSGFPEAIEVDRH